MSLLSASADKSLVVNQVDLLKLKACKTTQIAQQEDLLNLSQTA
jgi:hypothetical protein